MDNKLLQFHTYEFGKDEKFISGWRTIKQNDDNVIEQFLKAKIFYYSKFIDKICLEDYLAWLDDQPLDEKSDSAIDADRSIELPQKHDVGETSLSPIDDSDQTAPSAGTRAILVDGMSDVSCDGGSDTNITPITVESTKMNSDSSEVGEKCDTAVLLKAECSPDQQYKSESKPEKTEQTESEFRPSFEEVIQLVEKGEEIPGIEDIKVDPTNEPPTLSAVNRVKKPWEK